MLKLRNVVYLTSNLQRPNSQNDSDGYEDDGYFYEYFLIF